MSDADLGSTPPESPLLFVALGTHPRPFSRLLAWTASWAVDHPRWRIEVQQGVTPAPGFAHAVPVLGGDDLRRLLRIAAVVVTDGEQATISSAREAGHVPVVVPRDSRLGEHVDDRQILVARRLGVAGLVWLAESEAGLARAIGGALAAAAGSADEIALPDDSAPPQAPVEDRRAQGRHRGPHAAGRRRAVRRRRRRP